MIVQTKSGKMLHGEIDKDQVLRDAGQKRVLKFDLKASRTQDESGKWQSFFVGVNLWHGIDQWDGMLQKGDQVTVFAQKLKEREYNGKIYYDVDADDVQPGGLVTFRWLQQMIDLMASGITSGKKKVKDALEGMTGEMSVIAKANVVSKATGRGATGRTTGGRTVTQNVNINNQFNGDRAGQQKSSEAMDKAAGDATGEMASALAFAK